MSFRSLEERLKNLKVPTSNVGGPGPRRPSGPGDRKPKRHQNRVLCRTSEYQPPGSDEVGLGPKNQPCKVVWELDYGLSEDQFKKLSARFPGVAFVQTGFDCHDHPIAHTSYRVVWENVVKKLRPGLKCADLSGNPAYNESFNKRQERRDNKISIDTFCKVMCPKDSVRAKTRWGPKVVDGKIRWEEMTLYDMYRNEENVKRFAKYDAFLMNHVLYYYTMDEVCRLLNMNQESCLYATLHKLDGQNGTINCGEQEFHKDMLTGEVTQSNVETGEQYVHPDPAPWFSKFCYADEYGAFAWTINKGCDDTYVITATSTDPKLVPEHCWKDGKIIMRSNGETITVCTQEAVDPPPAYTAKKVVVKSHDLVPGYHTGKEKEIHITHPELFESLKAFMINKPRTARTLTDLTAKAHREAGNNTLIGNNKRLKISAEALTEHIFASWVNGIEMESDLFSGIVANNHSVSSVNRNLAGKTLSTGPSNVAKQAVRAAMGITAVMRSNRPIDEVLNHMDSLL